MADAALLARYNAAVRRREPWLGLWNEAHRYTVPYHDPRSETPGEPAKSRGRKFGAELFDGTATDAVWDLAAMLMAEVTPPWRQWFELRPAKVVPDGQRAGDKAELEDAAALAWSAFGSSNFAAVMPSGYLEDVIKGTATLLFEDGEDGEDTFKFEIVPMGEMCVEEGPDGRLTRHYRTRMWRKDQAEYEFKTKIRDDITHDRNGEKYVKVVQAIEPQARAYRYTAMAGPIGGDVTVHGFPTDGRNVRVLQTRTLDISPFITWRGFGALPGEIYGRGPVINALADIKTAHKTVELILKNASIAVTGIWQADDDGVLNPSTIRLVPGTIIPKAVGSAGLTPLQSPARFDVSQLVLEELRERIRSALYVSPTRQAPVSRMTATEVLQRQSGYARSMATFWSMARRELTERLVLRALNILNRRGAVGDLGRFDIWYASRLARAQEIENAQNAVLWAGTAAELGQDAAAAVDYEQVARYLGEALGVPNDLMRSETEVADAGVVAGVIDGAGDALAAEAAVAIGQGGLAA